MKLAEALVLRAGLQKRIAQMRQRLQQCALVQEGEQPPEDPKELLAELDQVLNQLGALIGSLWTRDFVPFEAHPIVIV